MAKKGLPFVLAFMLAIVAGCSSEKVQDEYAWSPEDKVTLTVWTPDEAYFKKEYAAAFTVKHPNVTFRYALPDRDRPELWLDEMTAANPDIVLLDEEQYNQSALHGDLVDLEARYAETGERLPQMHQAAEQLLRKYGEGKLLGVSPMLRTSALFYNQSLFNQYGIPVPQGQLTWAELYKLAARFPSADGSGIVGYAPEQASTWNQLLRWGQSEGLSMLTPDRKSVLLGADSWRPIFEQLVTAMRSGSVYNLPLSDSNPKTLYIDHPFVNGKAALMLGNASYGNLLMNAKFEWGVVNAPVGTALSNANPDYGLLDIVSIHSGSRNKGAASVFLSFVSGPDWPQSYASSHPYNTISNPLFALQEDREGRTIASFYALQPSVGTTAGPNLSAASEAEMAAIVEDETSLAVSDKQSIDEAIQAIVAKGERVLLQAAQS